MALSTTEENKFKEIMKMFQNAKQLSDLPETKDKNPYNLFLEVLDNNGESKKANIASLIPYFHTHYAYGIEFDTTVSSPDLKRIGNMDLHKTLPIQSKMKGCLLDNNGKVVKYLDSDDWTGEVRDGSQGQVMVEIPTHYRKCESEGTLRRVYISELPLDGYIQIPKCYVSAYEASLKRSTNELCSVVNTTADYRGGDYTTNHSDWDWTYRNLLGKPITNIDRYNFLKYAQKRGGLEWSSYLYTIHRTIYWLFVIEYATFNSQKAFNTSKDSNGYSQGGLGKGVTTFDYTTWNNFYLTNPFIPCGWSDSLGNNSGEVEYKTRASSSGTDQVFRVNRYRGIELPFGHIWKITADVNVYKEKTGNGGSGLSKVYICEDLSKFSNNGYNDYTYVGDLVTSTGIGKEMIFGKYGDILPKISGSSTSTYLCDYHYTLMPQEGTRIASLTLGGESSSGAAGGLAASNTINLPTFSTMYYGTRLCYIPLLI